jgi:bacterioferritin (cytochrome b1)
MKRNTIYEDAYLVDLNTGSAVAVNAAMDAEEPPKTRWEEIQLKFAVETRPEDEVLLNGLIRELLSIAIVDEQLAELNYLQSYNLEKTEGKTDFDPEFEQHESDEREHKYELIERLRELDAEVIFLPVDQWIHMNSRGVEWKQEFDVQSSDVILRRLEEEKQAVEFYTLATEFVKGTADSTTYTLFKKIKEDEEEHVKDLRDLARDHGFLAINED